MKPNERWVMTECSEWSLTMRVPLLPEGETGEGETVRRDIDEDRKDESRDVEAPGDVAGVPSVDLRRRR